jgi:hypothetical protein
LLKKDWPQERKRVAAERKTHGVEVSNDVFRFGRCAERGRSIIYARIEEKVAVWHSGDRLPERFAAIASQ